MNLDQLLPLQALQRGEHGIGPLGRGKLKND
jgi:hypothetical protein